MKRLLIAAIAALSLSLSVPVQASLSGQDMLGRINGLIAQKKVVQVQNDFSLLCQYPWADTMRISLNFPMPDALKTATPDQISKEATRICCEVRQAIDPAWSCWYVQP